MNSLLYEKHAGLRVTKRLLGNILLDGQFVSRQDLQAAIERQKKTNDQLGEILVGMGVLDPVELKAVLSIQRELVSVEDSVKVGAGVRMLLGELLIKAKRLTREQLDIALQEQIQTGEKLGELLLRRGLLMENELLAVLTFQRHQSGEVPAQEKLRIGELLVATEQITRKQLEDVLDKQKLSKKKIGELLIEAGYVQPEQIDHALKLQQKLVTAALVATLSLANMAVVQEAYAGTFSGTALSTKINITAQVLEHTSMQVLSQVQELVITNADISSGYVEVVAASRINVKTNNRAGCLLAFEVNDGPERIFDTVSVRIGSREVQLSSGQGWVPQPYVPGGATQDLSYRFVLSKAAQPGTYNWPLMISALSL